MARPGIHTWAWILFVCTSPMFWGKAGAETGYMVTFPAVVKAGSLTKFCVSLLKPSETLVMTINLISEETNMTLLHTTSSTEFHSCHQFKAPLVQSYRMKVEVEVKGDTFYSLETRIIQIQVHHPRTFIQTDKPIYLPGQTVHFRIFSLDTKFRPTDELYTTIELRDAQDNQIGQWLNTSSNGKIFQLSHSLDSEACEGSYRIIVSTKSKPTQRYHFFTVERYVLPTFDVQVTAPDYINIWQEDTKMKVCGKYTYGQPVSGSVNLKLFHLTILCYQETKQTERNGCATFRIGLSHFPKADFTYMSVFHLSVRLEEEGTGISHSREKIIKLSREAGKLFFFDMTSLNREGSHVEGKVKVVSFNNTPVPNKQVYLFDGYGWSSSTPSQVLTTDHNGIATFSRIRNHCEQFQLIASITKNRYDNREHFANGYHTGEPVCASSLRVKNKEKRLICGEEENFSIQYALMREPQGPVDVIYLILSKRQILMQGHQKVEVQNGAVTKGEISFTMMVSAEMAPKLSVVAYTVLHNHLVIAHHADFTVEKCFSHKVSLEFPASLALPGEETTLQLTADPGSLCGVGVVDQSIYVVQPRFKLTADKIYDFDAMLHYFEGFWQECNNEVPRSMDTGNVKMAYSTLREVGLKMATNLFTREHCFSGGQAPGSPGSHTDSTKRTERFFFPETWLWDLVEVGETGKKSVPVTVPDTITTWETEAFCLSSQGFGLAARKELTVSQPFFLELSLPYSIVRGENSEVKATVFNYLSSCIMVTVTAAPSLDYSLTRLSSDQDTFCLCANDRKTLRWTLAPSVVGVVNVSVTAEAVASHVLCDNQIVSVPDRGRIDVVTRSLRVKAEGSKVTKTYKWLFFPKGDALSEEVELHLPENVINGSVRASVSVMGDPLGQALNKLLRQHKLPAGSGEENLALLARTIFIMEYLSNTQQLTTGIRQRATNILSSAGYQRQLNFKKSSGAFSNSKDGLEHTWLTATALKSLAKAQSFIHIDPFIIQSSRSWLEGEQQRNGCFKITGELLDIRMKGGVFDEVTLTAYITSAFLEMNMSVNHRPVKRGLSCLRNFNRDLHNTYTTALLAYVFTLAGNKIIRAKLLSKLDSVAIQKGDLLYWTQRPSDMSLSVDISSYVVLAKLSASPTAEDMSYATRIIKWLVGQQNDYGGFSSTQALQALALYSTLAFTPEGSSSVTVQSPSVQLTFLLDQSNKLLHQEKILQDVRGKFSLEVNGTTCAAIQISLHYNIPTASVVTTLNVEVTSSSDCHTSHEPYLKLNIQSLYSGEQITTNMVILDIQLLSGFDPVLQSLSSLRRSVLVDHVKRKEDHVVVYIQRLYKDIPLFHSIKFKRKFPVQNLMPAVVKIFDSHQPSDQAVTEYTFTPCTKA